ncbi:MAG: phosphoribosylformylglycinamidine synthase I [Candidatus Latescibacteria bacterium]|jgi:phosphoribosylformylglycinamidine synthase subunit PurQ / glutaminase|nr:phosphoribosylformylglycinamidine synthase I [Candidatus Latescibacterota bacterium]
MAKPKALILRTAGTNCDEESAFAAGQSGFEAERVHINRIASGEVSLENYSFLFIPGGFSYGDDVAAGKIMALELNKRFGDALVQFEEKGKLVLGVCNGFQVLIKTGLLPFHAANVSEMRATLTDNDSGKFEDRWVHLRAEPENVCVFSRTMKPVIELPIAHGEGKFIVKSEKDIEELESNGQVVLRYVSRSGGIPSYPEDPNGSMGHIAGVCNKKGTILGLMPHPERFLHYTNHPRWTRGNIPEEGDGMAFFNNAYVYCSEM